MLHTFETSDVAMIALIFLVVMVPIAIHFAPRGKDREPDQ